MKQQSFNKTPLATGVALALGVTSLTTASAQEIEEVVVTGVRSSLTSAANMKRTAQGVSDGIVAEDIGKFPDTNLAESLAAHYRRIDRSNDPRWCPRRRLESHGTRHRFGL